MIISNSYKIHLNRDITSGIKNETPSHYAKSIIVDNLHTNSVDINQSQNSQHSRISQYMQPAITENKKRIKFMSNKNMNNGGKSSLIGAGEMMLNIKDYNLQNSYNPQNNKNNSKDIKYANSRLKILEELFLLF